MKQFVVAATNPRPKGAHDSADSALFHFHLVGPTLSPIQMAVSAYVYNLGPLCLRRSPNAFVVRWNFDLFVFYFELLVASSLPSIRPIADAMGQRRANTQTRVVFSSLLRLFDALALNRGIVFRETIDIRPALLLLPPSISEKKSIACLSIISIVLCSAGRSEDERGLLGAL